MRKKHLVFLSLGYFLIGIFLLLNTKLGITGAVIGTANITSMLSLVLGLVFILIGVGLVFVEEEGGLEEKIVEENSNLNRKIEIETDRLIEKFKEAKSPSEKKYISKLLSAYLVAPLRKSKYGKLLPHDARELPNFGATFRRSNYKPLGGSKRDVHLNVIHYTTKRDYDSIMEGIKKGEDKIILDSPTGWAFFLDTPIRSGIKYVGDIRKALGIKKPNEKESQKEMYFIKIPIKVDSSRVWFNEEELDIDGKRERKIKYAISGGVSKEDIRDMKRVYGRKYS